MQYKTFKQKPVARKEVPTREHDVTTSSTCSTCYTANSDTELLSLRLYK